MIYTITLNPALDHIILMKDDLVVGKTNYYQDEYEVIGGKGINVAIILNNLNAPVTAIGLLGTENKHIFLNTFAQINLVNQFTLVTGKTRTNYKIKNLSSGQESELNGTGFRVTNDNVLELLNYLEKKLTNGDIVVATGNVAKDMSVEIYKQIGEIVENKKAIYICDTANEAMINALKAKPFLIKPNLDEIYGVLKVKPIKNPDLSQIIILVNEMKKLGAKNILLSMGIDGSYYFQDEDIYHIGIAKGKLVNSVGAGDSMLAGFVFGLVNNYSIEETLQYASACGGATAFNQWLASKEEIDKYLKKIEVKKIK